MQMNQQNHPKMMHSLIIEPFKSLFLHVLISQYHRTTKYHQFFRYRAAQVLSPRQRGTVR